MTAGHNPTPTLAAGRPHVPPRRRLPALLSALDVSAVEATILGADLKDTGVVPAVRSNSVYVDGFDLALGSSLLRGGLEAELRFTTPVFASRFRGRDAYRQYLQFVVGDVVDTAVLTVDKR